MVNLTVGDRVELVKPYVSCCLPRGKPYGRRLIHKLGAKGTVEKIKLGNVLVKWDEPYRGMEYSGRRKFWRFERCEGPW